MPVPVTAGLPGAARSAAGDGAKAAAGAATERSAEPPLLFRFRDPGFNRALEAAFAERIASRGTSAGSNAGCGSTAEALAGERENVAACSEWAMG